VAVEEPKGGEMRGSLVGPEAGVDQKKPKENLEDKIRAIVDEAIALALGDFEGWVHEVINQTFEEFWDEIYNYYGSPDDDDGAAAEVRKAFVKTTPGAAETVTCWLSDTDGQGDEITVNCCVVNGSALNSAIPRLVDGEPIYVAQTPNGDWVCLTVFQTSEDCVCS
jgi:hypothetical protein